MKIFEHFGRNWRKYLGGLGVAGIIGGIYTANIYTNNATRQSEPNAPAAHAVTVDPNSPGGFISGISNMTGEFRSDIEGIGADFQKNIGNTLEDHRIRTMKKYQEEIKRMLCSKTHETGERFGYAADSFSEGLQEPNEPDE